MSGGERTDHSEPVGPRATSAVSPWLFIRRSSLPARNTSELPDFRTSGRSAFSGESSPIRSRWRLPIQTERRPSVALKLGDDAISKQSAPLLLCRSRPCRVWGKRTSERTLRAGGISAASALRFPPRTFPRRWAKSDVRQPIKRTRRSCGVAIVTYETTNRSGRKICTMRHFSRVAMGNSPRDLTWQAGKGPIMANQVDHAPRWHCRLGYSSGGVDRPYGETTN